MRLTADFLVTIKALQDLAANDNRVGDLDYMVRNTVTSDLTYTLAQFTRDDGAS